jgi:hypothetical protein
VLGEEEEAETLTELDLPSLEELDGLGGAGLWGMGIPLATVLLSLAGLGWTDQLLGDEEAGWGDLLGLR